MIIDTHAHVVPDSLIAQLRAEGRLFRSVELSAEDMAPRMRIARGASSLSGAKNVNLGKPWPTSSPRSFLSV
jgi:hypothetical protein